MDIALWELKTKTLGTPLSWLLGRALTAVPVYGSGGFTSLGDDELGRQLGTWVHEDGTSSVKMKIGGTTAERDVRRMNLARQAIGGVGQLDQSDLHHPAGRSRPALASCCSVDNEAVYFRVVGGAAVAFGVLLVLVSPFIHKPVGSVR